MGMVVNKEVDFGMPISGTFLRRQFVQFSKPVLMNFKYTLATKKRTSMVKSIMDIWHQNAVIYGILMIVLVLMLSSLALKRYFNAPSAYKEAMFHIIGLFLLQGAPSWLSNSRPTMKILSFTSILFALLVTSVFSALLSSHLSVVVPARQVVIDRTIRVHRGGGEGVYSPDKYYIEPSPALENFCPHVVKIGEFI